MCTPIVGRKAQRHLEICHTRMEAKIESHEGSKFFMMQTREEGVLAGELQRLLVSLYCVPVAAGLIN